ncbi:MAG: hypothetical protein HOP15_11285 [Planctomycetes bacterium]|nr:hypothetical protein [Planctomycetota bacterium]
MPFDEVRAPLVALLSQPIAVASVIFLAGIHAAIWLLVFERVGFPPVLAALLLVPPFTFLMPVFLALARWPAREEPVRIPRRLRSARTRPVQRLVQPRRSAGPLPVALGHRRPLLLAADGLPRMRIHLEPSTDDRFSAPARW